MQTKRDNGGELTNQPVNELTSFPHRILFILLGSLAQQLHRVGFGAGLQDAAEVYAVEVAVDV